MTTGWRAAADIADQAEVFASVVERNRTALATARDLIADARVVRFAAFGSSKHAAGYGTVALDLFAGIPSTVLAAPGANVALPPSRPNEPLVVVSQSGRTPALVRVGQRARDAGVPVIAVTNEPGSPLEEIATVTLDCHAAPERVVAATKSVSAQCLLLRALARMPSPAESDALVRAIRKVLTLDVSSVVRTEIPGAVVCAGFAAEWVADEIALKLIEMCGVPVTSETVVEHFHGPRASEARLLAFLDPTDPNSGEIARGRDVVTVGPHPAFDLETPAIGEPSLDALVAIVAGQLLARGWSVARGDDPDADRGLHKVTATR